jgi:hypothetical protein
MRVLVHKHSISVEAKEAQTEEGTHEGMYVRTKLDIALVESRRMGEELSESE